jgi:two-component system OmpR family response regulator
MRLLLVEDNAKLADYVCLGLREAGLETDKALTAEEASAALAAQAYDLVVLDLGLPDRDGLSLLGDIRKGNRNVPVIILTARDGLGDRIKGLDGGADDYLVKPFAIEELAARIRALLRRPGQSLGTMLQAGNVTYNVENRDVAIGEKLLRLTRRELDLLEQLMRSAGQVVPKEKIESRLYSYGETGSANSIEVLVHRLRKKLEGVEADIQIHTLRGVGYLLSEPEKA